MQNFLPCCHYGNIEFYFQARIGNVRYNDWYANANGDGDDFKRQDKPSFTIVMSCHHCSGQLVVGKVNH